MSEPLRSGEYNAVCNGYAHKVWGGKGTLSLFFSIDNMLGETVKKQHKVSGSWSIATIRGCLGPINVIGVMANNSYLMMMDADEVLRLHQTGATINESFDLRCNVYVKRREGTGQWSGQIFDDIHLVLPRRELAVPDWALSYQSRRNDDISWDDAIPVESVKVKEQTEDELPF